MDLWIRFAEKIPLNESSRKAVDFLRGCAAKQTGDSRALSHIQLYRIYDEQATRRSLFSKPFHSLAQYHLEEALLWAESWPEPLGVVGAQQISEGEFSKGLKNLASYVEKRRSWIKAESDSDDSERLDLCRRLALGASTYSQLGQFRTARDWYREALEKFKRMETANSDGGVIKETVLLGILNCLVLEFRYPDALQFIDEALTGAVFSDKSASRNQFIASKKLLQGLVAGTSDFQSLTQAGELWSSLMEDIQQCATPETARETRSKILTEIKTHDVNREIQSLAVTVEDAMRRQLAVVESAKPEFPSIETPPPHPTDLSKIHDPEMRAQLEKLTRATHALFEEQRASERRLYKISCFVFEAALRIGRKNLARVEIIAAEVYRIPLRYRAKWWWLSASRFVVLIVFVAYFLGKVVDTFLEKSGDSLAEILDIKRGKLIIPIIVLLIGVGLDHFVGKKIDEYSLVRYKRLLARIVADRSSRLWTTYNVLLKMLAQMNEAIAKLEEQLAMRKNLTLPVPPETHPP